MTIRTLQQSKWLYLAAAFLAWGIVTQQETHQVAAATTTEVASSVMNQPDVELDTTYAAQAAVTKWRYKTVNGIIYRRQYNVTTDSWIGKWVRV
ncbi:hypothetical protein [Lapidilactobacillus salsurivasis]